jgi:hypothetical protein
MSKRLTKFMLLHHKERKWANYVRDYSSLGGLEKSGIAEIVIDSLPQQNAHVSFARLPDRVRRLLFFAKPDLVICIDDGVKPVQPIFAIDVTEHVAARDHWIQRFPNLVGCAQEGVPGAFVAPRDMPKRKPFPGKTDPVFFFAYDRVVEIHQTPIYIAEWPATDEANLDSDAKYTELPPHDSPDMRRTLQFLDLVIDAAIKGQDLTKLMRERLIVDLRNEVRRIGYQAIPSIGEFQRLTLNMPDERPLTRKEFRDWVDGRGLTLPTDLPDRIAKRNKNVIVSPFAKRDDGNRKRLLERIKQKGGDPHTQQPLVFDYLFCRLGPSPSERDANLVIDLSSLQFADFAAYVRSTWENSPLQYTDFRDVKQKIPIYTLHLGEGLSQVMKNFVRLYAYAADVLVFEDGILYF